MKGPLLTGNKTASKDAFERLFSLVSPEPNTGCWIWIGAMGPHGYGQFRFNGRPRLAHSASYEIAKGPILEGLVLDHLCRVRCCCNPDHLEAVTRRVNALRGASPAALRARAALITHCPRGHEYSVENTYFGVRGRQCRQCRRLIRASRRKMI